MQLEPGDLDFIVRRIGRRSVGVIGVAARCPEGHPAVAVSYPVRRERGGVVPFPTLYWLVCPRLHQTLARLEMEGAIAVIQTLVREDPRLRARLTEDHHRYIAARRAVLSGGDRELLRTHPALACLEARGIGGVSDPTAVKCLHAHYAHHLADGNVVGEWLDEQFDLARCPASVPIGSLAS